MTPVGAWAGSQPLIPSGEQSGLLTHTAATESVSLCCADKKLTAFVKLELAGRACGHLEGQSSLRS